MLSCMSMLRGDTMRIDVLGVGFDNLTMAEAVEQGMKLLHSEGTHYVVTPNPEIVEICRENPHR